MWKCWLKNSFFPQIFSTQLFPLTFPGGSFIPYKFSLLLLEFIAGHFSPAHYEELLYTAHEKSDSMWKEYHELSSVVTTCVTKELSAQRYYLHETLTWPTERFHAGWTHRGDANCCYQDTLLTTLVLRHCGPEPDWLTVTVWQTLLDIHPNEKLLIRKLKNDLYRLKKEQQHDDLRSEETAAFTEQFK